MSVTVKLEPLYYATGEDEWCQSDGCMNRDMNGIVTITVANAVFRVWVCLEHMAAIHEQLERDQADKENKEGATSTS